MIDQFLITDLGVTDPGWPIVAVLIPFLTAGLLFISRHRAAYLSWISVIGTGSSFLVIASMGPPILRGIVIESARWPILPGIDFGLRVDPLGYLLALTLVFSHLIAIPIILSLHDPSGHRSLDPWIPGCVLASLGAAVGVAFAANLFVMFLFFEAFTLLTYPLIRRGIEGHTRRTAYQYLTYAVVGGILILGGLRVVFVISGSVTFVPGGIPMPLDGTTGNQWIGRVGGGLLVLGFGIKAGVVPFHAWLVGSRITQTAVFGTVFVVTAVKIGSLGLLRTVLEIFGPVGIESIGFAGVLFALAGVTIVTGHLLAVLAKSLKTRITYLGIAGSAHATLGIVVITPESVTGSVLFLGTHAIALVTLFLAIAVLEAERGVTTIEDLSNRGSDNRILLVVLGLSAASLAGLPPVVGFVSLWTLLVGTTSAGFQLGSFLLMFSFIFHIVVLWPIIAGVMGIEGIGQWRRGSRKQFERRTLLRPDGGSSPSRMPSGFASHGSRQFWERRLPLLVAAGIIVALGLVPEWSGFVSLGRLLAEATIGMVVIT